jgi:hypothetical protein
MISDCSPGVSFAPPSVTARYPAIQDANGHGPGQDDDAMLSRPGQAVAGFGIGPELAEMGFQLGCYLAAGWLVWLPRARGGSDDGFGRVGDLSEHCFEEGASLCPGCGAGVAG